MKTERLFPKAFPTNKNIKTYGLLKTLILSLAIIVSSGVVNAQYCTPEDTVGCAGGDQYQTFITSGGVSNIDHEPGGACAGDAGGYAQFSGAGLSCSGMHGTSISFSILNNATWPEGYAIWIDWNQDSVFQASEEVFASSSFLGPDSTANGSFIIPANAVLGTTALRIRCLYNTIGTSIDPCAAYTWGITFDFPFTVLNSAPVFAGGSPQLLTACGNAATDINSLLAVNDIDPGQTETWSVTSAPTHGTLGGFPGSMFSTGSTLTPTGFSYSPGIGYIGNDTFSVTVDDGNGGTATTTIYVTVIPSPAPISGTGSLCAGGSTLLSEGDSGGTWSSGNSSVASVDGSGSLFAISGGIATISYTGANGCSATADETVNAIPDVTPMDIPAVCNASITGIIHFTGSVPGTTFNWTRDHTNIGLADTSGIDSIGSFLALNSADTAVSAIIMVTPSTASCTGAVQSFTITVKPTPSVAPVTGQSVCNTATTTGINFTGSAVASTVYTWTNSNSSIGLASTGTGNIDPFPASNVTSAPVIATIMVTPVADGCQGTAQTFSITVNPTPDVAASDNQIVCNGTPTTGIIFTGSVSGTTFNWVNGDTTIGLASSGIDSIPSFIGRNDSSFSVTSSIIVTATANSCVGSSNSFTIRVDPTPKLNSGLVASSICNNTVFNYTPVSATAGTTFSWSRDTVTGISNVAATGFGGISETLVNTTALPIQVTYIYALVASGCTDTQNVKVIVNPTPMLTSTLTPTAVCDSALFTYTSTSATPGTTYTWSRATVGGISNAAGSGSGAISERLENTTNTPIVVFYVDTLTANGCRHTQNISVTVNPKPLLSTATTAPSICDNTLFTYVPGGTVSGTTFTWSRAVITGISNPAASGVDTISETLVNTSVNPIMVVYVDTLTANGCVNTENIQVTVNPKPILTTTLTPAGLCDSSIFNYTPESATTGTTFAWNRPFVLGIALADSSGTGNPDEKLINTSNSNLDVTYIYTLTANGCSDTQNVVVVVHPTPTLSSSLTENVCSGSVFRYVPIDSGFVFGTTYSWVRPNIAGILPATDSGSNVVINETLTDTALVPLHTRYIFTLKANGCTHIQVMDVTVNPAPPAAEITTHPPSSVCSNTRYQNFGTNTPPPAGQQYSWSAVNATIWASGTGGQYVLVSFPAQGNAVITLNSNITGFACRTNNTYAVAVSGSTSETPEVIYNENNGQFSCLEGDADNYQWGFDDAHTLDSTLVEGEVNQSYFIGTPDFANRYYWVITNHNGCMQKSYYNVPTGITSINTGDLSAIKIYPNPASSVINVDINTAVSGSVEVQILNMLGQKLNSTLAVDHKAQINIAGLPAGCYLVDCYSNGVKLAAARFIKN